jgi:acetylornithine deacetylase/succinyl-diaminopimelate desuccinylase-like protein
LFTIGDVKILPGLENVVPEFAYCSIDFRVGNAQILDKLDQNLKSFIVDMTRQGQFTVETDIILRLPPVPMNEEVCLAIESSADEVDISHMRISSGAGHDAQVLAKKVPTAMIFVPSKDGRSHRPDEYSAPEDICNGAEVLLRTILTLAR